MNNRLKSILTQVDIIVKEYQQEGNGESSNISLSTIKNIKKFLKLLYKNNVIISDIIVSPLGYIYCEWVKDGTSIGVGFKDDLIVFEYVGAKFVEFVQRIIISDKVFLITLDKVKEKLV